MGKRRERGSKREENRKGKGKNEGIRNGEGAGSVGNEIKLVTTLYTPDNRSVTQEVVSQCCYQNVSLSYQNASLSYYTLANF